MSDDVEKLCDAATLQQAISEIFNTMIFLDVGSADDVDGVDEDAPIGDSMLGVISFSGQYEGSWSICCTLPCAKEVTMNLLAFEDESEVQDSDIPDAMGEVVNMTMGILKRLLYDKVGEISVSVPSVHRGASLQSQSLAGQTKLTTMVGISDRHCMAGSLVYRKAEKKHE